MRIPLEVGPRSARPAAGLSRVLAVAAVLTVGLVLAAPAAGLEQKLTVADRIQAGQFGRSVAVDGDTAVVGAPFVNNDRGAAYVFARFGDNWVHTATLTTADGEADDRFGASVAIQGDTIVAGAPGVNVEGRFGLKDDQGSTYTFARTGPAARTEISELTTAALGAEGDGLGTSVAIDGDTIVAGAPGANVDGRSGLKDNQGAAYTFARTGAAERTPTAKLTTALLGAADDQLGTSVAIDGDTIVAGARYHDAGQEDQGSAYTFARTGAAERTQTATLTVSGGARFARLGASVAIDRDTIVVGAPGDVVGANRYQGSAYTFARMGPAARNQTAKLTALDGAELDSLGASVAIDGNAVVVGAPGDDVANPSQGSAYTFARTGPAARNQTAKLTASGGAGFDELGTSVALAGDTIIAGAPARRREEAAGVHATAVGDYMGYASIFFAPAAARATTPPVRPRPAGLMAGPCANGKRGTSAADALAGTPAGDAIFGLGGRDLLSGLAGDDCLLGGSEADRLLGGPDADRLQGDRGNDVAAGGAGRDRLLGGDGKDRLSGESGNDTLAGGSGNDTLTGGRGRNGYAAGSGNDTVNARNRQRERVDCGPGRDKASVDRSDRVRRCERVRRR